MYLRSLHASSLILLLGSCFGLKSRKLPVWELRFSTSHSEPGIRGGANCCFRAALDHAAGSLVDLGGICGGLGGIGDFF